jgi:hypothetical protein
MNDKTAMEKAAQHVAEAKEIVERQRERIARLKLSGFPAGSEERTLQVLLRNLQAFEDYEQRLSRLSPRGSDKTHES